MDVILRVQDGSKLFSRITKSFLDVVCEDGRDSLRSKSSVLFVGENIPELGVTDIS